MSFKRGVSPHQKLKIGKHREKPIPKFITDTHFSTGIGGQIGSIGIIVEATALNVKL